MTKDSPFLGNFYSSLNHFFFVDGSYEVVQIMDKEKHAVEGPIYYYVFNTLLFCLLVLHIYWWVLMFRMLVKQIQARGQLSDDVRSGKFKEKKCQYMPLFWFTNCLWMVA